MGSKETNLHPDDSSSDEDDYDDDDDDDDDDDIDQENHSPSRRKREVAEEERCKGPSTSSLRTWANAGVYLDPARAGNPVFGSRMQLYCRTGYHLSILHSGKVLGSEQDFNKFAVVELSSVDIGEVRIRGVETNLYLSMNNNGRLYGEGNVNHEGTIFIEDMDDGYSSYRSKEHEGWYIGINKADYIAGDGENKKDGSQLSTVFVESVAGQYNTYLSRKHAHMGWYVAIKKSGKPKNGKKTKWGQKSTQFLPRRT